MYNRYIRNDNGVYTRIPQEERQQQPQQQSPRQPPPPSAPPPKQAVSSVPILHRLHRLRHHLAETAAGRMGSQAFCGTFWTSCIWTMWTPET